MNKQRFTDKQNLVHFANDFIRRRYGISIFVLLGCFFLTYLSIITPLYMNIKGDIWTIAIIAAVALIILAIIMSFSLYRLNDFIMATEFQNAIFADAAKADTEFVVIFKEDGHIVYADNGFNKYFAPQIKQGLTGINALLDSKGLSKGDKKKLINAMHSRCASKINFVYDDENYITKMDVVVEPLTDFCKKKNFNVSIKPSNRPKGFFVLKAFKPKSINNEIFNNFASAVYAVNNKDELIYFNKYFAELLGYNDEELNLKHQKLSQLIFKDEKGTRTFFTKNAKLLHTVDNLIVKNNDEDCAYHIVIELPKENIDNFQLWHIIDHSPIASALINKNGDIEKTNLSFKKIFIMNNNKETDNIFNYLHSNNIDEVKNLISYIGSEENIESQNVKYIEVNATANNSAKTLILYINKIIINEQGNIIVYIIDITEQKNLEVNFVHSQKMQAIGQLSGGIAHDFNNLLTAMTGFCDLLLLRHPPGDGSFANIMQIKQNANRASNLVRQLLAFSRKQVLQPKILNVTNVITEIADLLRRLIGEDIELKIEHGKDLSLIKVDQGQLEQVIINLAVNARDAMINGGNLTIVTQNIVINDINSIDSTWVSPVEGENIEDGEYVLIKVADTGEGIASNIITKVFEPFFSTKALGAGTGLGLSTVYGIIKQTGGEIYLTSSDKGTIFYMLFKAYNENNDDSQDTDILTTIDGDKEEIYNQINMEDLTGEGTILLVEDEVPVRIFASNALQNKGYKILEADNGSSALEIIDKEQGNIDLIITDIIMPELNGPEFIKQIVNEYPNIKIIFISGYAEDYFDDIYPNNRKINFLPKPFTLKDLAYKVKTTMIEGNI